jgi:hypothetical protein
VDDDRLRDILKSLAHGLGALTRGDSANAADFAVHALELLEGDEKAAPPK